jgi:TolB-like protein
MIAGSIALAPFENLSGNPNEDYFAQGFVEDLATELSRFGTLEVIYPRAVAVFMRANAAGRDAVPIADNILRGSIRRAEGVVRIAVQLVAAATGRQLWADRYDAGAGELLAVQDDIVARIARALAARVDETRLVAARRTPLTSLEAYDCWLRGMDCLRKGTIEADDEARACFTRALELDCNYSRAYAGLSLSHFNEWSCQAWERWDEKERLAYEYAARAAELDDSDAIIRVVLGRILLYRRRFPEGAHHIERALTLNSNDTDVLSHAALCRVYLGEGESALDLAQKAMRLNPSFPPWYTAPVGMALFVLGRDTEAIEVGIRAPMATLVDVPAYVAAACALAGDTVRARLFLNRFLAEFRARITFGRQPEPGEPLRWLLHINPFFRDQDAARWAQGLRLAGLDSDPDDARPEAVVHVASTDTAGPTFRHDGLLWTFAFEGLAVQLTSQKGFHDLARLLSQPGQEIHCLELADRPAETGEPQPVVDARARSEIHARVRELQQEIDRAAADNDCARADPAREELDRIVEVMSAALGVRGRARRLGSAAERARSTVTWRIRSAVKKISAAHPRLGRHLENTIRTGTFCVYRPETTLEWSV